MASLVATTVNGNLNFETAGQYLTFYGGGETEHSISSRNSSGNAADDLRINTFGALFINLDSNNNNSSGADFSIGRHGQTGAITDWLLDLSGESGKLTLSKYGSGTHTGTLAKSLGVDSSGNVIEFTAGGGTVTGSGTTNYVPKFTSSTALGNSALYDGGGSNIGIGTNNPYYALDVRFTNNATGFSGGSSGNWGGSGLRLQNASTTAGAMALIQFRTSTTEWFIGNKFISSSPDKSDFIFNHEDSEKVRFTNDGNVGMGTETPYRNAHIYQAADGNQYEGALQVGGNSASVGGYFGYNSLSSGRLTISSLNNAGGANAKIYLGFGLDSDGSPSTEVMTLNQDGNVGIGSNAPPTKFHVLGNTGHTQVVNIKSTLTTGGCYMQFTNATADLGYFGWGSTGNNDCYIVNNGGSNTGAIRLYAGSSTKLQVNSNGSISTSSVSTAHITCGYPSTNGGVFLRKHYSDPHYVNVLSSHYSNGNTCIGYGAAGKEGGSGYVATYGNFSGNKSILELSGQTLTFKCTASAAQSTVGADITLVNKLVVSNTSLSIPQGNLFFLDGGSNTYIYSDTADSIALATNSGVRLTANNNGVVINGNILYFGSTSGGFVYNDSSVMRLAGDAGIKLQTYVGGWQDRLVILDGGSVGIGTNAPSEVLEVKGNIIIRGETNNRLKIANDSNNNWAEIGNDGATGANTLEFFTGSSSTSSLSITNGGYAAFAYASQVRLTLGSTGTPGNNDANWIRSNGANLEFNAASGDFNWEVAGAHKMRLTDTGFLGLGLGAGTDPFGTLHVNGSNGSKIHITRTSGSTTSTFGSIIFGNTDIDSSCAEITGDQDGATDSGRLEFGTQATVVGGVVTRMTIKSSGSVGIGTGTPQGKLDINTEAAEATHVYINGEANQDKLLYFRHYANSEGAGANAYVGYIGSKGTDNLLSLGHLNTSGSDVPVMHLTESGLVGIGTKTPSTEGLEIAKASADTTFNVNDQADSMLVLRNSDNGSMNTGRFCAIQMKINSSGSAAEGTIRTQFAGNGNADLIFSTTKAGTGVDRMVIDEDGSVGIGTGAPLNLLNVYGGNDISPTSGGAGQFGVQGNGYKTFLAMDSQAAYFGHNSSARELVLMTNETARLSITGGGAATFSSSVAASSFSGNGASLTSLNGSNISSGTVAAARLGSGSSITTKFLRGDNTWQTVSGGGGDTVSITTSAADILSVSSGAISAVDAGSGDRIVFWDNGSNKLAYLDNGDGLSFSGTNLVVTDRVKRIYKGSTSSGTYVSPDSSGYLSFYEGTGIALSFSGSSITFSSSTGSDYRLKKNISTFNSEAWTKVKGVNLRKFDFDEDAFKAAVASPDREITEEPKNYTDNVGFIAHELAEVGIQGSVIGDKDAVDEDGNFIYQKVNYIALVPVLWGALKEAISKIETLESKVQALEDK